MSQEQIQLINLIKSLKPRGTTHKLRIGENEHAVKATGHTMQEIKNHNQSVENWEIGHASANQDLTEKLDKVISKIAISTKDFNLLIAEIITKNNN